MSDAEALAPVSLAPHAPVVVVGAGPAGLMAAERLSAAGLQVHVYDAMASVGRKFLLAGKGGLNLTHAEPAERFATRYGARQAEVAPWLEGFGADAVRAWSEGLGIGTFVGSSDRVFPTDMKAAPLLRAWLHRLRHPAIGEPVQFHMRHRWSGWAEDGALRFSSPAGETAVQAGAVVLALGGGSWKRLGSDGAWVPLLEARGVPVVPLAPANCGFDVAGRPAGGDDEVESRRGFLKALVGRGDAPTTGWTPVFAERFAGQPFKSVAIRVETQDGRRFARRGEFVATATGVEGSLVYAASALLRDEIAAHGSATFHLDLLPDRTPEQVLAEVRHPRGSRSLSSHLKSRLGIDGIKAGILYELLGKEAMGQPAALAAAIKALPVTLAAPRPLDEAISSAGGVPFEAMDAHGMFAALPGVFCAGEMVDWEAPTGGYLMTACMASGVAAAAGVCAFLGRAPASR
ncbi:TIGR03862 family flavoprotein [Xylophilus sp. Leaf220]|uniref:TIGR03862 family flavoprotein n=1 Tax=Xylophilus sp. Leaf220 TaxID=1735686 RepID=UPI0006FF0DB9|nr:TIGR03862 family flavoprotein [Xylophilus sp. Leaf220]KQM68691.1 NAD(FAD)-utilizing dehydrogenase [Xylophilus sp. Leaf220]